MRRLDLRGLDLARAYRLTALGFFGYKAATLLVNALTYPRLFPRPLPAARPRVSLLVPARDEAHNLPRTLPGLLAQGDNYLTETAASGAANLGVAGLDGRGNIRQGMLEASNVNVVEELVDMIETQRAYEVNSKMISATDDMLKYVNQNI